ncbi:MAG: starch-binding protein [Bacilli bacterium]|nr:starch-binding protein [Bacilli bacterium]
MKTNIKLAISSIALASLLFACQSNVPTSSSGGESSVSESQNSSEESEKSTEEVTSTSTSESKEEKSSLPAIDYVKVFTETSWENIWAWTAEKVNLFESWPGVPLNEYDENWKTYDFEGYTSINLVFNKDGGKSQTSDLYVPHAGYWWYYQNNWYEVNPLEHGEVISSSSDDFSVPEEQSQSQIAESSSYLDFPVWTEFDDSHWKVINPYTGKRDDFRDESIYFAMTTRFYDGDSSNNVKCWDGRNNADGDPAWRGDFKGLIEKMDYIKALGFTAIWITPVTENASGYDYHGYHTINFTKVDARYESEDVAFQDVINAAHARDMKIVLDVVFNHTCNFGEENLFPMFYKDESNQTISGLHQNDTSLLPSNYSTMNGNEQYDARINAMKNDDSDVNGIYHHEKGMAYEQFIEQTGQMAGDCVDLNTENPTVANYLVKSYGEFIRMGVDAFRIDTMKHISRLTFNNYLWPAFYHYAEKCGNNHFYMFGEVCTRVREVWNHGQPADSCPFYTWKESKTYPWGDSATNLASTEKLWNDNCNTSGQPTSDNAYLRNGFTYHTPDHSRSSGCSTIDFPMHWNFQYASSAFGVAVGGDQYYNDATYNVVYVDSHDYGPDCIEKVRYNMGTSAWAENMDLMFTFRGVPCIYYGSEIEFQAGKTIDEGPNIALANSGRAYYGDHLEGSVNATGFGDYTASGEVASTLNSTLCKHLMKLNKIRQMVPALRRGQYSTSGVNGGMAFVRRYTVGSTDSLACVSISGGASFSGLPNGKYVDLVSGDVKNVTSGSLSTSQSGQGSLRVYVLENSSTGSLSKVGDSLTYLK